MAALSRPDSWIQFGALSAQRDSFRVHKPIILRTIEHETRADGCLFCPAFRWQRVRADVADLPEIIELGADSLFEILRNNEARFLAKNPRKWTCLKTHYVAKGIGPAPLTRAAKADC